MNNLLDQTEKSGAHRILITNILKKAGLVKDASEKSFDVPTDCVVRYADKVANQWPMVSPESVVESATSIEFQKNNMTNLKHARLVNELFHTAELFECLGAVKNATDAVEAERRSTVKQASLKYALIEAAAFPINDITSIEKSAKDFCATRVDYPYPWRVKAASAILEASEDQGAKLDFDDKCTLEASASQGTGVLGPIAREFAHRASKMASRKPELAHRFYLQAIELATVNERLENDPLLIQEVAKSACEAMDRIDEALDLRCLYGGELQFPEDAAFPITVSKIAAAVEVLIEIGGVLYRKDEVAKVKSAALTMLSKDLVDKISDDGYVNPDKLQEHIKEANTDILQRVMHGFGVKSVSATPDTQASMASVVQAEEINHWCRIAGDYGSDVVQEMDGSLRIVYPNMPTGLGVDIEL